MLIPDICSEHASLLYVLECRPPCLTYHLYALLRKRSSLVAIVITRFVMNTLLICCLPLNIIDEFLVSKFVDVKRVQYNDFTLLQIYQLLKSNDGYTNT
jgi:hypothetical protein